MTRPRRRASQDRWTELHRLLKAIGRLAHAAAIIDAGTKGGDRDLVAAISFESELRLIRRAVDREISRVTVERLDYDRRRQIRVDKYGA